MPKKVMSVQNTEFLLKLLVSGLISVTLANTSIVWIVCGINGLIKMKNAKCVTFRLTVISGVKDFM